LNIVDDNNIHHHHGRSIGNDRVFGKCCVVFTDKAHLHEC